MVKPIVFWGATGQARVLHEFIGALGYELVALFDNQAETPSPFPDAPIYYGEAAFRRWRAERGGDDLAALVAVGGAHGRDRLQIQRFLEGEGCVSIVAVHPAAFVAANAQIASGGQVLARAAVCADVTLGEGCIVNTAASVDHECVLGDGVHVAPGATLCGCVTVGDYAFIGAGATALPRISIGRDAIIGAGSVVTRDVPDGAVVYGNPARPAGATR